MRVIVQNDNHENVAIHYFPDDMPPRTLGQVLTGHDRAPLGWLGRALAEARIYTTAREGTKEA